MNDELAGQLRRAATGAFASAPVRFAYLFGSRARGDERSTSDIDIAVYLNELLSSQDRFQLSLTLPDDFGRILQRSVDLTVLNDATLSIRGRVALEGRMIFSVDEPARFVYESRTFREYLDFERFLSPIREQFIRDTAEGRR